MLGKSRLKYIQSLAHKKQRDAEGAFIAEGPKLAKELVAEMPANVQEIYALDSWIENNPDAAAAGIRVTGVTSEELSRISQLVTSNEVLLVVKKPGPVNAMQAAGMVTLALDTIQDPGNLGTIIRIADWFGISQLVCSHETADVYNPKVVQATMGSICRVKVYYTHLHEWIRTNAGAGIYAAALEGKDITKMDKLKEGVILIGNESRGIEESLLQLVQTRITIPGKGRAESLNAAVATGIILSHLV